MIHVFIFNPYAGSQFFADDLRKKLEQIKDLKYFVFNTRYAGDETELVKKILRFFDDEKLRIYCCGGSGTFCNMINGIDNLQDVEIAFFPCGLSNSFLESFGEEKAVAFRNIENLVMGEAVPIDYIKTNRGIAINAVSIGYDQSIISEVDKFRGLSLLGKHMPYLLGMLHGFLLTRPNSYDVVIGDKTYSGICAQIIFANGCRLAGMRLAPKADVTDGLASYFVCPDLGIWRFQKAVRYLLRKKLSRKEDFFIIGKADTFSVKRKDGKKVWIDLDGEMQAPCDECRAEVVHKGINFVLPKGVTLNE